MQPFTEKVVTYFLPDMCVCAYYSWRVCFLVGISGFLLQFWDFILYMPAWSVGALKFREWLCSNPDVCTCLLRIWKLLCDGSGFHSIHVVHVLGSVVSVSGGSRIGFSLIPLCVLICLLVQDFWSFLWQTRMCEDTWERYFWVYNGASRLSSRGFVR